MDIFSSLPYPTGELPENPGPLGRYLPPIPQGIAPDYLQQVAGKGAWVLDPFGASPLLILEMARLGYRVLAAVNNPIARYLLEVGAAAYPRSEFQAALAELASSRKGSERIETHLQSLYLTSCTKCAQTIPAEAFIWDRELAAPTAKIIHCAACSEYGERPTDEADRERAAAMAAASGLHRARALERVAAMDDDERENVEEALKSYPPRAVYALITIINKLDGLQLSHKRRSCLQALILTACDEANTLWAYPEERRRPKVLTVPPRYRENNVWLALERGLDIWESFSSATPFTTWPDQPPRSGGICLFEGPLRDLAGHINEVHIEAVLTTLPRPNQAYWTLCALWAGWLWGRQAVQPFKMVLRRRRYDWNWHAEALQSALKNLTPNLPLTAPMYAIMAEPEPNFITAASVAATSSGFNLGGLALRTKDDAAYLLWHRRAFVHTPTSDASPDETVEARSVDVSHLDDEPEPSEADFLDAAMRGYLTLRGEPVTYLHLHAACLSALAGTRVLNWHEEAISQIHAPIIENLKSASFTQHGGTENPETGYWGLSTVELKSEPLPDQVERAVAAYLGEHPGCTMDELETALYAVLRGLLTPSLATTHCVLDSYAITADDGHLRLRYEDEPDRRADDLEQIGEILCSLAKRFRVKVVEPASASEPLLWQKKQQTIYAFYLQTSAVVGKLLRGSLFPPAHSLLVLPGGRAGLLAYKLERDPALKSIWESGWRALKYRQLRKLSEMTALTLQKWEEQLTADPILQPEQMSLF